MTVVLQKKGELMEGSSKCRVAFEMLIVAEIFQETSFETP
jgi:hypothetical protein